MNNRQYSQDNARMTGRGPKGKLLSLSSCVIGLALCIVLAIAAFGGYTFLIARGETGPLVLIHAPQHGDRLVTGQSTAVRAVASDKRKIVRVELWVDGRLVKSEKSNVAGGIASFPLLADWQPASPGAHIILVRAFNTAGMRAHSSINVNVLADRDGDGAADDSDTCPDQPGAATSQGCADRDMDGTADSADACPDVAGVPEAQGCASAAAGDRDGDGSSDAADVCPDTPGSSLLEGCPDTDGDLVADNHDACPTESGAGTSDGCPAPAGDADGDGAADGADVCPAEWGLPEHAGCPEVASGPDDGILLGTGTRDSDGDGASDDVDPCPHEAGSPEDAFCPPPESDTSAEGEADPRDLFPGEEAAANLVEFEALHYQLSQVYQGVWCYVQLAGGDIRRYDFEPNDERQWDIALVLGGENGVSLGLSEGQPVGVFVECFGTTDPAERPHYLGSVSQEHFTEDWDGHVIAATSAGGEAGHSFEARYHLCASSCEALALQPPVITHYTADADRIHLDWEWAGDRSTIGGFKLYVNGNLVQAFPRDHNDATWLPPEGMACVDTWEFRLTAFAGPDMVHADLESPPSNTVAWDSVPCEERIRVTFASLDLHSFAGDEDGMPTPGPIIGDFAVSAGGSLESVFFDAAHCMDVPLWGEMCFGLRLPAGVSSIQGILDEIRASPDACGSGCPFSAPASDTVTLSANRGDDLTIAARIIDADPGNPDDILFDERITINIDSLSPDSTVTLTLPGDHANLIVLVDRFPFDP